MSGNPKPYNREQEVQAAQQQRLAELRLAAQQRECQYCGSLLEGNGWYCGNCGGC